MRAIAKRPVRPAAPSPTLARAARQQANASSKPGSRSRNGRPGRRPRLSAGLGTSAWVGEAGPDEGWASVKAAAFSIHRREQLQTARAAHHHGRRYQCAFGSNRRSQELWLTPSDAAAPASGPVSSRGAVSIDGTMSGAVTVSPKSLTYSESGI